MKTALEEAQANLAFAQNRARDYANRSRREEKFQIGDQVLLSTRNLQVDLHLPKKLRRKFVGPYKVIEVVSSLAYRLDLPPDWKVHPVFHVDTLKRYHQSTEFAREEKPPPPIIFAGEEEYEVEAILKHKGQGARCLYQVMWKGYPITEASWEPESHLQNAPQILEEYLHRVAAEQKGLRRRNRRVQSTG